MNRAKQTSRHERRALKAATSRGVEHVIIFDRPPVQFMGTIGDYIERLANLRHMNPGEWSEHDQAMIDALRQAHAEGRLALHRSADGLVYGIEVYAVPVEMPISGNPCSALPPLRKAGVRHVDARARVA